MRKVIFIVVVLLSLGAVAGCGPLAPQRAPVFGRQVEEKEELVKEVPLLLPVAPTPVPIPAPGEALADMGTATERLIVRRANISLVVEDTEKSLGEVKRIAESLDGFVADSSVYRVEEDRFRASVTIRVPAESFDAAMEQIRGLALEVEGENISGQDVTEEYVDLSARLRNLEATETELLELLTEVREKTKKAEDVLAVHRELTSIREEIERIKGRMQYLERSVALATITVELIPKELEKPVVEPGWAPLRTLRDASRGLIRALEFLVDVAIWLVVFALPILLILLSPFVLAFWLWRRRRRKREQPN
ncbi:MAG: DUF4349 domain-containing protein [Anaerolineae bacterium]